MKYRKLGKTGFKVSEVSYGGWAIGGSWGPVDDERSKEALQTALDNGINFLILLMSMETAIVKS